MSKMSINYSDLPTVTRWARPVTNFWGLQMKTLDVTLLGLFCGKVLGQANEDLLGLAHGDFKVIDFDYLIPSTIITVILTILPLQHNG